MSTFTPGDLTFNGREIESVKEAVLEGFFNKPELNAFHTIMEDVKNNEQIGIAGLLGNVGKASVGCPPAADGTIPWSEKFWAPADIDIRLVQCWKDLLPSFQAWGLKNSIAKKDLGGTDYWNFVSDRISDAWLEAIYRIAWLSDTTEDDIAGLGNITDGVAPEYYTMTDGLSKQFIALPAAQRVTITENAGASYALQVLGTDAGLAILEGLKYDAADFRLRDAKNQVIICTQSIADNYASTLRSQGNDLSYERIEGGYQRLFFEGIPVIPFALLDRKIRADFDTTVVHFLPHRAFYSTVENIQIGFDSAAEMLNVWFNPETTNNGQDMSWKQDQKLVLDYLGAVAF